MKQDTTISQALHPWRVAVIGGGFSGLSAAHRLIELCETAETPLELTLFDSASHSGGVVGTREIAGYRVELGADSFITNKPWAVDLCRRLGLEDRLIPTDAAFRRSLVLRKGKPVAVPDGFQLLTPVKIAPLLMSPVFTPWGKLRMACEYFLPRGGTGTDESLAHFVRRRFGQEALERLVQPLVGGIYTSDPEKLSLRATMARFLEMERDHRSLIRALRRQASQGGERESSSGARYGLFATLAGGISELVETLAARVNRSAHVRFGTRVVAIHPQPDSTGYRIEVAEPPPERGESKSYDAVLVAIPAYAASELVAPVAPQAARALSKIEYASTAIVVSGHQLKDIAHPLNAFGIVVPAIERRKILAVSFTSRKFPGRAPEGHVQLRTFVGGAMQPELMALSDEQLIELVRTELESILGVRGTPDFTIVARWNRAMPQYHVGHLDLIAEIEQDMARHPQLALAGNAYHGVGLPDCIHSGEQAAESVFAARRHAVPHV